MMMRSRDCSNSNEVMLKVTKWLFCHSAHKDAATATAAVAVTAPK